MANKILTLDDFARELRKSAIEKKPQMAVKGDLPFLSLFVDTNPPMCFVIECNTERISKRIQNLGLSTIGFSSFYRDHRPIMKVFKGSSSFIKDVSKESDRMIGLIANPLGMYNQLESLAEELVIKKMPDYFRLWKFFTRKYDAPNTRTASIVWDESNRRFVIRINRKFVVQNMVDNIFGGRTGPDLFTRAAQFIQNKDLTNSVLAIAASEVFLHEITHAIYRHTAKKSKDDADVSHGFLNQYMDSVVNSAVWARLENLLKSKMKVGVTADPKGILYALDTSIMPATCVSDMVSYRVSKVTLYLIEKVFKKGFSIGSVDISMNTKGFTLPTLQNPIHRDTINPGILVVNPLPLIKCGLPCIIVMRIVEYLVSQFDCEAIEGGKKKMRVPSLEDMVNSPPVEPPNEEDIFSGVFAKRKDIEIEIQNGDYVIIKQTGTSGKVVGVEPNGDYKIEDLGVSAHSLCKSLRQGETDVER